MAVFCAVAKGTKYNASEDLYSRQVGWVEPTDSEFLQETLWPWTVDTDSASITTLKHQNLVHDIARNNWRFSCPAGRNGLGGDRRGACGAALAFYSLVE